MPRPDNDDPARRCDTGLPILAQLMFLLSFFVPCGAVLAQQAPLDGPAGKQEPAQAPARPSAPVEHRFWDKTNVTLFAGVGASRALDFHSTRYFRTRGYNEGLLNNDIVDNTPLFAGIEAAGTAVSIGLSYWLHRTGHHKLERWVSIVHIGVTTAGAARNYSIGGRPLSVPGQPVP